MAIKIILSIYFVCWTLLFTYYKGTPIQAIKVSISHRGVFKTFIFFLVVPLQYFNSILEKVVELIEKFLCFCMDY